MMYLSKFLHFIYLKFKGPEASSHIHGVFVDIKGKGILIIGKSGIGKSEVALDLIDKGHKLIADDSVSFYKRNQNTLMGKSPALLKNLMEVRGLGIINIKKLFGRKSVIPERELFLVIELKVFQKDIDFSRLEMTMNAFRFFDINIPKIEIPVTQTRHISLLIETAVKNYILLQKGSNAINNFSEKLNLQLSLDH
jgi:serine kinase of HPr protein (carbohydrate metabolism regulator)